MIHFTWLIFTVIILAIVVMIVKEKFGYKGGDYSFDLATPLWIAILVTFILIWGGIFWW